MRAPRDGARRMRWRWHEPASIGEAVRLQERLRGRVIRARTFASLSTIGAVDCAHAPGRALGCAGILVYRYPELTERARVVVARPVRFPYVPGLLAFRELPLILAAVESLTTMPDVFLVDGQGIAHPRWLGIASHLGLLLDSSTIGCAKRVLVGHARPPDPEPGAVSGLTDGVERIGALVRTLSRCGRPTAWRASNGAPCRTRRAPARRARISRGRPRRGPAS
jgi:deoxyribonuclease V